VLPRSVLQWARHPLDTRLGVRAFFPYDLKHMSKCTQILFVGRVEIRTFRNDERMTFSQRCDIEEAVAGCETVTVIGGIWFQETTLVRVIFIRTIALFR
jgi:hypothetical protein